MMSLKKMAHHANEMLEVRSAYKEELKALNQNLESKVEERTLELQKNIEDLKALQDKLIQKEKNGYCWRIGTRFCS